MVASLRSGAHPRILRLSLSLSGFHVRGTLINNTRNTDLHAGDIRVIYNRGWIPFRSRRAERTATRRSRGGVENPAMHHFELIIASEGQTAG